MLGIRPSLQTSGGLARVRTYVVGSRPVAILQYKRPPSTPGTELRCPRRGANRNVADLAYDGKQHAVLRFLRSIGVHPTGESTAAKHLAQWKKAGWRGDSTGIREKWAHPQWSQAEWAEWSAGVWPRAQRSPSPQRPRALRTPTPPRARRGMSPSLRLQQRGSSSSSHYPREEGYQRETTWPRSLPVPPPPPAPQEPRRRSPPPRARASPDPTEWLREEPEDQQRADKKNKITRR